MSLALYRKYRPQTFGEIVGQNHIKVTIENEISTGKIAHAYLFSGPRGLGKTTIARLIAKSVNCLNRKDGQSEPCNNCEACQEILDNRSLDVIEIDAASHTGVDNVRENIIANARFTPTNRKYKVFIIDEVHMLSISAFNALLKTLEEPPNHALFILATTEIHKIPQTIISRCQHFDFRKVPMADIVERLAEITKKEKKEVDRDVLERIARWSEGGVRDAESLLGQLLSLNGKKITAEQAELVLPASHFNLVFELIADLLKSDAASALVLVNQLIQDGVDLQKFIGDLIEVLRKLLLSKIGGNLDQFTVVLSADWQTELKKILDSVEVGKLIKTIELFIKAQKEIKSAEIIQLPIELAIVESCVAADDEKEISNKNDDSSSGSGQLSGQPLTKEPKSVKNDDAAPALAVKSKPKIVEERPDKPERKGMKFDITLDQIKSKWEEVLDQLKIHNQSLSSTLKQHGPTAVKSDGVVEISFKYKFYQQRVNEIKNRTLIENILEQVFNLPLIVQTVIVKHIDEQKKVIEETAESPGQQGNLDNLVQAFGGQLVE
ncbi:MAG: DNA polymerase III subunit gamma/tau [Candidatus Buchananbacteria bacterium]|nr:DNA polymerase III subunit gamma/tau [Candidatus Buchananbacteria bacterium]